MEKKTACSQCSTEQEINGTSLMAKDTFQRIVKRTTGKDRCKNQTLYTLKFMALNLWHDEVLQFVTKPLLFAGTERDLNHVPFLASIIEDMIYHSWNAGTMKTI